MGFRKRKPSDSDERILPAKRAKIMDGNLNGYDPTQYFPRILEMTPFEFEETGHFINKFSKRECLAKDVRHTYSTWVPNIVEVESMFTEIVDGKKSRLLGYKGVRTGEDDFRVTVSSHTMYLPFLVFLTSTTMEVYELEKELAKFEYEVWMALSESGVYPYNEQIENTIEKRIEKMTIESFTRQLAKLRKINTEKKYKRIKKLMFLDLNQTESATEKPTMNLLAPNKFLKLVGTLREEDRQIFPEEDEDGKKIMLTDFQRASNSLAMIGQEVFDVLKESERRKKNTRQGNKKFLDYEKLIENSSESEFGTFEYLLAKIASKLEKRNTKHFIDHVNGFLSDCMTWQLERYFDLYRRMPKEEGSKWSYVLQFIRFRNKVKRHRQKQNETADTATETNSN